MACPVCQARQIVEIGINLGSDKVTLHSCSRCDTRWWDKEGTQVPVDRVLTLAAQR